MKRKILYSILILLTIAVGVIFYLLQPSCDMKDYEKYYVDDISKPQNNQVKATFLGVSTLFFDDGETQILIDGFFTRKSTFEILTSKISSDTTLIDDLIEKYQMNRLNGLFATHSHFDHAFDVAYTTKRTNATLFGSLSTINIGRGGGVKEEQMKQFMAYDTFQLGKFTVTILPSIHSQPNTLNDDGIVIEKPISQPVKIKDLSEGGSFDFLIKHEGKSIFIKPSPNFLEGVLDTIRADYAFLGIATIDKKDLAWQNKFYDQTVGNLKAKVVVPLHWDDFTKPLSENLEMLPKYADKTSKCFDFMIEKTAKDKIEFKILQGGKSIILN